MYQKYLLSVQDTERQRTDARTFHDQFNQGKACGLFTTSEAAKLLETPVSTSGSIIPDDGPTAVNRPGSPRVDSCSYTARKSSDGYVDIILKTYDGKKDAEKYYTQELAKLFTTIPRASDGLGQKLSYGDGAFYLLKDDQVIEVSASYTPRQTSEATEQLGRSILVGIVTKL